MKNPAEPFATLLKNIDCPFGRADSELYICRVSFRTQSGIRVSYDIS